jgi:uncharacterized membrane protein
MSSTPLPTPRAVRLGALLFAVVTCVVSWWRWWTFQYTTFDLAFYVQALWLALRGQWQVSLLEVPLLGNHAEPIVFLLAPFFALWSHPMLFVLAQTLALATMPFTAWRIVARLGIEPVAGSLLALATVLTPATILVGLHEFHPEALAAPLILLLIEARLAERRAGFWVWFLAVLSVKENMALLLLAWCVVFAVIDWREGRAWVRWNLWPGLVAAAWLGSYSAWLSPWLNGGRVDYLELYSHLGATSGEIVRGLFLAPQRAAGALWRALTSGNLVWVLLLPLLGLPLLRPHWWLIAAPILLQHLLSWRPSEWSIGAHYPAPLIPLFWIAAAEAFSRLRAPRFVAVSMVSACLVGQVWVGPALALARAIPTIADTIDERTWKAALLDRIPAGASVMANQPYLSHLAQRERVLSLHHTLKGLKTLSRAAHETPAPTDAVFLDFEDGTTFNTAAGYYHPRMRTADGRDVPSSDRLLHEFLRQQPWRATSRNAVTLLMRGERLPDFDTGVPPVKFDASTTLRGVQFAEESGRLRLRFAWEFAGERERFPWMMLVLDDGVTSHVFLKGACVPEGDAGRHVEEWTLDTPPEVGPGEYALHAVFFDAASAFWDRRIPPADRMHVLQQLALGRHRISPLAGD